MKCTSHTTIITFYSAKEGIILVKTWLKSLYHWRNSFGYNRLCHVEIFVLQIVRVKSTSKKYTFVHQTFERCAYACVIYEEQECIAQIEMRENGPLIN